MHLVSNMRQKLKRTKKDLRLLLWVAREMFLVARKMFLVQTLVLIILFLKFKKKKKKVVLNSLLSHILHTLKSMLNL